MTHYIIELQNVCKTLNHKNILNNFSVKIPPKSVTYIQGTNGIGKSITLKIMSQLIKPSKGKLILNGSVSYMPDVFPGNNKVTVDEYLTTVFKIENSRNVKNIKKILNYYYDELNLNQFKNKELKQLSKGTLQKVNIIQTLLKDADIYILDEPFNGLDQQTLNNFIHILKKLKTNKTLILTSHEHKISQALATHILDLNNATYITNSILSKLTVKYIVIPYTSYLPKETLQYIDVNQTNQNKTILTVKSEYSNTLLQLLIQNNHTILEVKEEILC